MSDDSERLHDDSRASSIPTQHERNKQLEAEVARLRRQRDERKQRIAELEATVGMLLRHAKEAQEIHGVEAQGLIDEAKEALEGERGPYIQQLLDVWDRNGQMLDALGQIKDAAWSGTSSPAMQLNEIERIAQHALEGVEDDQS